MSILKCCLYIFFLNLSFLLRLTGDFELSLNQSSSFRSSDDHEAIKVLEEKNVIVNTNI